MSSASTKRLHWVDYAKALGIITVVFGHAKIPQPVIVWIYSFHMPLFFVLAGIVLPKSASGSGFPTFFRQRLSKLLKAYLIFAGIGVAHFVVTRTEDGPVSVFSAIFERSLSVIYASGSQVERSEQLYPVVLWYFPALIVALIVYFLIHQLPVIYRGSAAVGVLVIGYMLRGLALPWEVESGLMAASLVYFGSVLSHYLRPQSRNSGGAWVLAVVLLWIGAYLAFANGLVDFRRSMFGNSILAGSSFLCTGIGVYLAVRVLPPNDLVRRIADASILIFPTHTLGFWLIDFLGRRLASESILSNQAYVVGKCIAILALTTIISPILLKILGLQSRNQNKPESPPSREMSDAINQVR